MIQTRRPPPTRSVVTRILRLIGEPVRACLWCLTPLAEGPKHFCRRCSARSVLRLCRHQQALPSWRVLAWDPDAGVVASLSLTVGAVTVLAETLPFPLLSEETGRTLPIMPTRSARPGTEVLARLAVLGRCHVCDTTFLMPETEAVVVAFGDPWIVRAPTAGTEMHVFARPGPPHLDERGTLGA